ncbi:FIG00495699: hypothetical protein [hydrothermal vent metagenome]|uniref:Uncharacterized protein n=1 Tax=hydrothermal vent metagenome TaxID=652676 RepID=A0A1W1BLH8_9ZZZZ
MQEITVMEKYPVFKLELTKSDTKFKNVDEILSHFEEKISSHPVAKYIGIFDHYGHTTSLEVGKVSEDIIDAKNIIFCFGKELPKPEVLAIRPRSIGVAEMSDSFVISFMEAPNKDANNSMIEWVESTQLS